MIIFSRILLAKILFITLVIAAFVSSSSAAVPNEMIYEGRMLSKTGTVLTGTYSLRFSFWTSGDFTTNTLNADGTINIADADYSQWTEEIPITFGDAGYFSALLGKTNSLENFPIDQYKYLQVEIKKASEPLTAYQLLDINGDNGADTNDRKFIGSIPYAKNANSANNSTATSFTIDASDKIQNAGTGFIELEFGDTLAKFLRYDLDIHRFIFSDDLEVKGNLIITSNTGSVSISADNLTANRTITLLDEDMILVGQDTTQEITNKTIDANKNTILNLNIASLPPETRKKILYPSYPSTTLSTDTVNKFISVYTLKESGKSVYKVSSRKNSLQQGVFTTTVSLADFYNFNTGEVSLSFKTTTANIADNSVSIEVLDIDGNSIASQLNAISAGVWNTISLPLPPVFLPLDNTFIIKITPQVTDANSVYLREITITYKGL